MSKYNNELKNIQRHYLEILHSFSPDAEGEEFYFRAVSLIDKCESFWMSKRIELSVILDDLTDTEQCFLLSGAIYLDIANNGHYDFGAIGERNIINDPILRIKGFFDDCNKNVSIRLKEYFSDAISDTITVLERFGDYFIVISMESLLFADADENNKLAEKVYWDILSNVLNCNVRSIEALRTQFSTIDDLENGLGENAKRFIFSNMQDSDLSLTNRVKKWFNDNNQMKKMKLTNEIDLFFIASIAQIHQAFDILIKCSMFNLFPFIRFDVSFQYFVLLAEAFSDDDSLKRRIEYAIVCYLFVHYIIPENVYETDFFKYCNLCKER